MPQENINFLLAFLTILYLAETVSYISVGKHRAKYWLILSIMASSNNNNIVPMAAWYSISMVSESSSFPYIPFNNISENNSAGFVTSPNLIPSGPPPPRSAMPAQSLSGTFYPTTYTRKNPKPNWVDNSESEPRRANNYVYQSYMPTLPPTASQPSFQAGSTSVPNLTVGNSTGSADGNLCDRIDSSPQVTNCASCDLTFVQSSCQTLNTECQYPVYTESRTILESIEQNGQNFQGFMNYQSYQHESVSTSRVYQHTTTVFPPSSSIFDTNQFDGNHGSQGYSQY